jgi:hypothetical protein
LPGVRALVVAQDDDGFEVLAATERYPYVEFAQRDMEGE